MIKEIKPDRIKAIRRLNHEFIVNFEVKAADIYPPMAANPACPKVTCPVVMINQQLDARSELMNIKVITLMR